VEVLGQYVEFQPLCPEVGAGLGVPRPPVRLVRREHGTRALGVADSSLDVTEALEGYGREAVHGLGEVCACVLKTRSPSCGPSGVPVFDDFGKQVGESSGLFAAIIRGHRPNLPIADEEGLADTLRRDNFLEQLFVYHRWRTLRRNRADAAALVDFHTRHKFLILAHDETRYRALGPLVAAAGKADIGAVFDEYESLMMDALRNIATIGGQVNSLQHLAGFLKDRLEPAEKRTLLQVIDDYRHGRVSLQVPRSRLRELLARMPEAEPAAAVYLEPYPVELVL
jgi:uncharacterized protein YbgA (DUF1722 family)/uncharacterized protein YbbK (DUF523 family)